MEVSGRKESCDDLAGLARSAEKMPEPCCQPCFGEGQFEEAEGFCQNCKEYLCETCITYHRKVKLSKHHVILDKDSMPTVNKQPASKPTCTDICDKHGAEFVKFFCSQHQVVGCGDCMILEHKSCKVDYIADVAADFVNGVEFRSLVKDTERLMSVVEEIKAKVSRDKNNVATVYLEYVKDVRQFRKETDAYLDKMEQELLAQCEQLKKDNEDVIQGAVDDIKTAEIRLNDIHSQLTSMEEQVTSLFVKAKKTTTLIKELEEKLLRKDDQSRLQVGKFKGNPALISKSIPLGEIEITKFRSHQSKSKINLADSIPKEEGSIDVSSTLQTENAFMISGIAEIDQNMLACTDWCNKKVKLIDVRRAVVQAEIHLSSPWDLTYVPNDQLAVTLTTSKKIQFLSLTGRLSKSRVISVKGECRGIAYNKDRLFVTYGKPPKVEVMALKGEVLKCFKIDNEGNQLFTWPLHVAVDDMGFMYVSDSNNHSVVKLSFDGQILTTYKDKKLSDPRKLVVCNDGSILVCSCTGKCVHLLSPECRQMKILLDEKDGIDSCWALCYSDDTNTLYLSKQYTSNIIQAYKLS